MKAVAGDVSHCPVVPPLFLVSTPVRTKILKLVSLLDCSTNKQHHVMKLLTICFLSLAISVGFSAAQEDTEEELGKFKEFKVIYCQVFI